MDQKDKIGIALREILSLIKMGNFKKKEIKKFVKGFLEQDLLELRKKLIEARDENLSDASCWHEAVAHDRAFGHESASMDDYYDNEARSSARNVQDISSMRPLFNRAIDFLT